MRQHFVEALYAGQPFKVVLRDFGLTYNQVWGLTKSDEKWSEQLEAALMATRRDDLQHGTNAAYVAAAFARSVGSISSSGWPRTAEHQFSSIGILGARFGLRLSVVAHFAIYGRMRRSKLGGSQCAFVPF